MAFTTDTFARAAFKKLQGLAHTGSTKDPANESEGSQVTLGAQDIFAKVLPAAPLSAVSDGAAVFVTLDLELDPSSSGKGYFSKISTVSGSPLEGKKNSRTGVAYIDGDRVGNFVPTQYGSDYRAIVRDGATEIPPLSSEDWFFDYKSGILTSESNLSLSSGTIDGYVYTGLFLSDMKLTRKPIYPSASGLGPWVTIYVAIDGYDETGDGSISSPYRQPQRALEDIDLTGSGAFIIQCGPGQFQAPTFNQYQSGAGVEDVFYLNIVGDQSTISADITASSFSLTSGKHASVDATVGGFSSPDPYSYWANLQYVGVEGWPYGGTVLASPSDTVRLADTVSGIGFYDHVRYIHPYATTFTSNSSDYQTGNLSRSLQSPFQLSFVGIKFTGTTVLQVLGMDVGGCTFSGNTLSLHDSGGVFSSATGITRISGSSKLGIGGYINQSMSCETFVSLGSLTMNTYSGGHLLGFNNFMYIGDCDFIGTSVNIRVYNTSITQTGPISSNGTAALLELNQCSVFTASGTGTITGSITGTCVDLNSGSQAIGIKAAASGTLINSSVSGNEITVGGNAVTAFNLLPKTDLGLGDTSECCRAS